MRDIHISIVSHKQFELIKNILSDLESQIYKDRIQVTITINTPEEVSSDFSNYSYPINITHNKLCRGFSENHNKAFNQNNIFKECAYFLVVNPDVRLHDNVLMHLVTSLENNNNLGLIAPIVYGIDQTLEDSARELPTPYRIIAKIFGNKGRWDIMKCNQPDWVAGMFMAFRTSIFQELGGFDERYFLYYEDVDICSRAWLSGYVVQVHESASVIHDAQRTSRHNFGYFRRHVCSMLRFFNSVTYRKIKPFHRQRITSL